MENINTQAIEILDRARDAADGYIRPVDDLERVAEIAAVIGILTRDQYLAVRAEWRNRYREISRISHITKPMRKGGNTDAQYEVYRIRTNARRYMTVRHALTACARAHAAAKSPVAE